MLSELERNILEILSDDARIGTMQLAQMTGADEEEVKRTLAKLERDRVIIKYPAMINWDRVRDDIVQEIGRAHV